MLLKETLTFRRKLYDTKEKVLKNNPNFKIGNLAAGFFDIHSRTIYIFSDTIEKIQSKNYYNKSGENDNGLTFLILAAFHELEHYVQRLYPDKLSDERLGFPKSMLDMEGVIIGASKFLPDATKFDYNAFHDNFLLEIDADRKGTRNARRFAGYYNIQKVNQRYLDLMDEYNEFRINNYDTLVFVNEFIKIIGKYPDILKDRRWLNCDELMQFFNSSGTLKQINELMGIRSKLTPYFVSSIECIKSIDGLPLDDEQILFVSKCLNFVICEHDEKQKKLMKVSLSHIEAVFNELKRYTQVNCENSKKIKYIANENYYNYLHQVQQDLETFVKKLQENKMRNIFSV